MGPCQTGEPLGLASYESREKKTNPMKGRSFSGPLPLIFSAEKSSWSECTKDKKVKAGFESNPKFHAHEFSSPDTPRKTLRHKQGLAGENTFSNHLGRPNSDEKRET